MADSAMTLFWPPLTQKPAQNAATNSTQAGAEMATPKSATNTTPAKYTAAKDAYGPSRSIAGPIANAATMPPIVVREVASATVFKSYFRLVRMVGSQRLSA